MISSGWPRASIPWPVAAAQTNRRPEGSCQMRHWVGVTSERSPPVQGVVFLAVGIYGAVTEWHPPAVPDQTAPGGGMGRDRASAAGCDK